MPSGGHHSPTAFILWPFPLSKKSPLDPPSPWSWLGAYIDLKSFYASVECMDRNLDPMTTNLVVADESRTEKTICLAVSPSLKAHGIPGRARLFEVIQRVRAVNAERRHRAPRGQFSGRSVNGPELHANPALELDYVVAVPRMARYMEVSAKIYSVYLKSLPSHTSLKLSFLSSCLSLR